MRFFLVYIHIPCDYLKKIMKRREVLDNTSNIKKQFLAFFTTFYSLTILTKCVPLNILLELKNNVELQILIFDLSKTSI